MIRPVSGRLRPPPPARRSWTQMSGGSPSPESGSEAVPKNQAAGDDRSLVSAEPLPEPPTADVATEPDAPSAPSWEHDAPVSNEAAYYPLIVPGQTSGQSPGTATDPLAQRAAPPVNRTNAPPVVPDAGRIDRCRGRPVGRPCRRRHGRTRRPARSRHTRQRRDRDPTSRRRSRRGVDARRPPRRPTSPGSSPRSAIRS